MEQANKETTKFTDVQIEKMKAEFATINTVDPRHLDKFHKMFDKLESDALIQLSQAGIKFVSPLARNACVRRKLIQIPSYESTIETNRR